MPLLYLIFLLHSLPCNQQTSPDSIIKITAPEVIAHAGKEAVINIYVVVKEGYHIQANKVNNEFIIPTVLNIIENKIIITGKQMFPAGKKFKLKGTGDYLFVYDGEFKIAIPFKTRQKIQKGKYMLVAELHYQACDDKTCFFPRMMDFPIEVKVI